MKSVDLNTSIIDGYLRLLDNLSPVTKLDLISRLSLSVKSDVRLKEKSFKQSFGGFDTKKSAEEIIKDIREARNFERKIEKI